MRLGLKERETQIIYYFIKVDCCVIAMQQSQKLKKKLNGDYAATWTNGGLVCRDEITDECMGELHLMLNHLGSGSISCLRRQSKLNVWCGLMKNRIIGSFFYCEPTVTGPVYLGILEQFIYPQVAAFQPSIIYQQDGAPPHWTFPSMRHFLIGELEATD